MAPEMENFLIMTGAFLLVAAGGLIWMFFFHKTRRRRREYRHHHHSGPPDITLSQTGGLPPDRPQAKPSGPQPPTPRS